MSFPRYPKYKDSGVEWLGNVPEHWSVKRLRFVAELNPSKSEIANLDPETTVSFLPMDSIGDDGTLSLDKEKTISDLESGYTYFRDGDVAVAKITPCYENGKGALMRGLKNGIGFGTTELIVARPKSTEITGTYLHYLFKSPDFRDLGESRMYGAGGQKRVPDAFVRNFANAFPPLSEQALIVAFLDRETSKIDMLVAEQKRLMELLKEKRQAVISNAVTKGLKPDVPMKSSGIKWLGDLPAHWEVSRIKRIATIRYGIGEPPKYHDDGTPLIRATNIHAGILLDKGMAFVNANEIPEQRIVWLETGDIIVVRSGAYTGDSAIIPEGYGPCIAGFDMVLKCHSAHSEFIQFTLLSKYLKEGQIDLEKTRAAQPHLNAEELGSCLVALPSTKEQREITTYLKSMCSEFDTLITEAQHAIDLLQERRTVLISAAVTGQIDVRHLTETQAL